MSDRHSRGSSLDSNPSPSKERTYLEPESNKSKGTPQRRRCSSTIFQLKTFAGGYLSPYYSPSLHGAKGPPSTSTSSSNKSSRPSSKSSKRSVPKAAIIHNDPDAPKDKDHYEKTSDARYYKNSFHDSGKAKKKDSMASKANDSKHYQHPSY